MTRIVKAPDERRSELIATAQQLFYTKGYERTSVSDIVKAVGVAQGTFTTLTRKQPFSKRWLPTYMTILPLSHGANLHLYKQPLSAFSTHHQAPCRS
jgi:hypothetical protein